MLWILGPLILAAGSIQAQTDPGPRSGAAGAGGPMPRLNTFEAEYFVEGAARFQEIEDVGDGFGPRFNGISCGSCHAQPAVGGSSPATNPQVAAAPPGQMTAVSSFISLHGPVREARFVKDLSTNKADGGVHALFTIVGRPDNPTGCAITQPDFATNLAHNNVIFRIPTPVFGGGLIEAIKESTIISNMNANTTLKSVLGISGHENRNGNDGTITRFGWKAQNKSLMLFTGEAYNVEQGITNEIFPNEREEDPRCATSGAPDDSTNFNLSVPEKIMSDMVGFSVFMRFSAPPTPVSSYGNVSANSISAGKAKFNLVGCGLCHTPSLQTGTSSSNALSGQTVNLFSDLLVHNMGSRLSDGVSQGNAGPNEFRTAPLWGLGQRLFFLHDGRTSDLVTAIQAHSSSGSEASAVIGVFNVLPQSDRQDILNFLRSL